MKKKYETVFSTVEITFNDGDVQRVRMSAGAGIAGYLMEEASRNGFLLVRDDSTGKAHMFPMAQVRSIEITPEEDRDD